MTKAPPIDLPDVTDVRHFNCLCPVAVLVIIKIMVGGVAANIIKQGHGTIQVSIDVGNLGVVTDVGPTSDPRWSDVGPMSEGGGAFVGTPSVGLV